MRKKILITYAHFLPAYKAGGPIQSIANLCRQMAGEYDFYVLCSDHELNENPPLNGIISNSWNDFESGAAQVYYISAGRRKPGILKSIIRQIDPDIVFANGVFLPFFSIMPLLQAPHKRILSVRGMLHPGALSQKQLKKRFFLAAIKWFGLHKKVVFHATDEEERRYINKTFGDVRIQIAQNFPKQSKQAPPVKKNAYELKLISIALISPMKNIHLVLQALKGVKANVQYDIYGPVKDEPYWDICKETIKNLPGNITVSYKNALPPDKMEGTLSTYHFFILPSKSENFGHAIYEALSLGKPVITSHFTPWNNLEQSRAGWNVDVSDTSALTKAIECAADMDNDTYLIWNEGAMDFTKKNIDLEGIKQQYRQLFN